MEVAELRMEIDARPLGKATTELDKLDDAAARTEATAQSMGDAVGSAGAKAEQAATGFGEAGARAGTLAEAIERAGGRSEKAAGSIARAADDASGAIDSQVRVTVKLADAVEAASAANDNAAQSADGMAGALAAANDNAGAVSGSLEEVAAQADTASTNMADVGVAIAGVGGAIAGLGTAIVSTAGDIATLAASALGFGSSLLVARGRVNTLVSGLALFKRVAPFAALAAGAFLLVKGVTAGVKATRNITGEAITLAGVQREAEAQVSAAIASTGGTAQRTLSDIQAVAAEIQGVSLFGDEATIRAGAQLLTFTGVVGDTYDRTLQSAADIASRMNRDIEQVVLQIGKAINDPVANLGALSESGIQFTAAQKGMIAALVEANDLGAAQAIILTELENQFGGAALAALEASDGVQALANTTGDLKEKLGTAIIEETAGATLGLAEAWRDPVWERSATAIGTLTGQIQALGTRLKALGIETLGGVIKGWFALQDVQDRVRASFWSLVAQMTAGTENISTAITAFVDVSVERLTTAFAPAWEVAKKAAQGFFDFFTGEVARFKADINDAIETVTGLGDRLLDVLPEGIRDRLGQVADGIRSIGEQSGVTSFAGDVRARADEIDAAKQHVFWTDALGVSLEGAIKKQKMLTAAAQASADAAATFVGGYIGASGSLTQELALLEGYNERLIADGEEAADKWLSVENAYQAILDAAVSAQVALSEAQQDSLRGVLEEIDARRTAIEETKRQRGEVTRLARETYDTSVGAALGAAGQGFNGSFTFGGIDRTTSEAETRLADAFEALDRDDFGAAEWADVQEAHRDTMDGLLADDRAAREAIFNQFLGGLKGSLDQALGDLIFNGGQNLGRIFEGAAQNIIGDSIIAPTVDGLLNGEGLSGLTDGINTLQANIGSLAEGLGASPELAAGLGTVGAAAGAGFAGFGVGSAVGGLVRGGNVNTANQAAGGLAGAGIGFALGGPIGAGIGAALGALAGSLVGNRSNFYATGDFDLANGRASNLNQRDRTEESNANAQARNQFFDILSDAQLALTGLTGATASGSLDVDFGSRDGFVVNGRQFETGDLQSALDFANGVVIDSLSGGEERLVGFARALDRAGTGIEDVIGGLEVFAAAVDTGNAAVSDYAETALLAGQSYERVGERVAALAQVASLVETPLSAVEQQLQAITEATHPAIEELRALGESVTGLEGLASAATRSLGQDALRDARDIILRAESPELARIADVIEGITRRNNDAAALFSAGGLSAEEVGFIRSAGGVELDSAVQGLGEDGLVRLGQMLGVVGPQVPGLDIASARADLEEELRRLTDGAEDTARGLEDAANRFRALAETLRDVEESILREFGDFNPRENVDQLTGRISGLLDQARLGNESALQALPSIASRLVDVGREAFGSTERFGDIRDFALGAVQEAATIAETLAAQRDAEAADVRTDAQLLGEIRLLLSDERELNTLQAILDEGRLQNQLIAAQLDTFVAMVRSPERPENQVDVEAIRDAAVAAILARQQEVTDLPGPASGASATPAGGATETERTALRELGQLVATGAAAQERQAAAIDRLADEIGDLAEEQRRDRINEVA